MNIQFCDLCNESVPQADLDRGTAVLRNERLICASCETAMTPHGGVEATLEALSQSADDTTIMDANEAAPIVGQRARASHGTTGSAAAVAFASVALICSVGASAWFFDVSKRLERVYIEEIRDLDATWREDMNSMEGRLTHSMRDATRNVASIENGMEGIDARFLSLEETQAAAWTGMHTDLAQLQAKIGELDSVLSAVARNEAQLSTLAASTAALHDDFLRITRRVRAIEGGGQRAAIDAPVIESAPERPKWLGTVENLSSKDAGTRWKAVQSLGDTSDPAVAEHLTPMLKDADIFVRMATARILGDLGATIGIPALIDALEDPEASVREAAVVSLRSVSGRAFSFDPGAAPSDRSKRVKAWRAWWKKNASDFVDNA